MKIRLILGLMAALCAFQQPAHADLISQIKPDGQDYVLEGSVVTIWEDSFLLNDGSGQLIVDIRPYTTYNLGLAGQDYVQVTGHLDDQRNLKPLVLTRAGVRSPVMFSGTDTLPPLPAREVMENTRRYSKVARFAPATAVAPKAATATTVTPCNTCGGGNLNGSANPAPTTPPPANPNAR